MVTSEIHKRIDILSKKKYFMDMLIILFKSCGSGFFDCVDKITE